MSARPRRWGVTHSATSAEPFMPLGLKRYQREGDDHFITFSCYRREPHFVTPFSKDTFLHSLEQTRGRYNLEILGYVIMPEHVHLILTPLCDASGSPIPLSKILRLIKGVSARRVNQLLKREGPSGRTNPSTMCSAPMKAWPIRWNTSVRTRYEGG